MKRFKKITLEQGTDLNIEKFPKMHKLNRMKELSTFTSSKDDLLVKCGEYFYNVTNEPNIYFKDAK